MLAGVDRMERSCYSSEEFLAAFNVLLSNIAIVMGPTPPGTGVIAFATCRADSK